MTARPAFELADVFRRHGETYAQLNAGHLGRVERRVSAAIAACRTAALGGHVERCDDCGLTRIAYNSCRNRHCPKCQGAARLKWLAARQAELLPVPYFHVVFTLPLAAAEIAFQNKRTVYGLLMRAAAQALSVLAAKRLGARIGLIAVLHTWGQTLTHHPHVHCLVPGGGVALDNRRWVEAKPNFLLSVHALSKAFRRLFLDGLKAESEKGELSFFGELARLAEPEAFKARMRALRQSPFVVYAKPPFGGPARLGRRSRRNPTNPLRSSSPQRQRPLPGPARRQRACQGNSLRLAHEDTAISRRLGVLLDASSAKAFRTSDWEIPNCRAICDGETPALKAARSAFNLPSARGTATPSTRCFCEFWFESFCEFWFEASFLPRRVCSTSTAAPNWSSSWSVSAFIALGKSRGRMCRCEEAVAAASVFAEKGRLTDGREGSRVDAVKNKSGVVDRVCPLPICQSCRHRHREAMGIRCLNTSPKRSEPCAIPRRSQCSHLSTESAPPGLTSLAARWGPKASRTSRAFRTRRELRSIVTPVTARRPAALSRV